MGDLVHVHIKLTREARGRFRDAAAEVGVPLGPFLEAVAIQHAARLASDRQVRSVATKVDTQRRARPGPRRKKDTDD